MARKSPAAGLLLPIIAALIACAVVVGMLARNRAGADALGSTTHSPKRYHSILYGITYPIFVAQSAKIQARELAKMKSIGINSIRFDADWDWVQPRGRTKFQWYRLDREIRSARAARMTVDLVIDGCPPWAALRGVAHSVSPQPASARQYGNWAREVAKRYTPLGVKVYEIWNEPNDTKYWQPRANPAFYARMLALAYRAIKRINRSAIVITGGLAPVLTKRGNYSPIAFLRAIYAHGAKGHFDALATHPYTFPILPGTYEPWSAWSQMSQTSPSLRGIMRQHGDGNKPIWITEFGAPSGGRYGVGFRGEAAELKQAILLARSSRWISAIYIYSWKDLGYLRSLNGDWYGLLRLNGRRKPAYYAVAAAIAAHR